MSMITILLTIILFVAMFVLFAILLPLAIIFNVRTGKAYREKLAGKIEKLRLGKMLSALGIDIDTYIARERGVDIHKHMNNCKACSNLEECDERIALFGRKALEDIARFLSFTAMPENRLGQVPGPAIVHEPGVAVHRLDKPDAP